MTLQDVSQRLLELAAGGKIFKVSSVSHFDTSDVIASQPFSLQIDENGKMNETVLYLRIQNENKKIYGLTLYQLPLEVTEQYQNPVRIQNINYFERTINNLPIVLDIINELGYEFDKKERFFFS